MHMFKCMYAQRFALTFSLSPPDSYKKNLIDAREETQ